MSRKKAKTNKKRVSRSTVILVLILLIGISVVLYPTVSDYVNQFSQSRAIVNYTAIVDEMSQDEIDALLDAAREYNTGLISDGGRYTMTDSEREYYNSLLNSDGTGIIGYIQISRIGVSLPIYHGTSDKVLASAIGHVEGSSLPVGGAGTHCILSGHRGLPSARLFTDLDELVEGDVFTITVLNQTLTYMVDQIRIVLPTEMSELDIETGEDYCTLVTCTPYGINTHRLLVRGTRIDNLDDFISIPAEALKIPTYIVAPVVMIPMLLMLLIWLVIRSRDKNLRRVEQLQQITSADLSKFTDIPMHSEEEK